MEVIRVVLLGNWIEELEFQKTEISAQASVPGRPACSGVDWRHRIQGKNKSKLNFLELSPVYLVDRTLCSVDRIHRKYRI